MKETIGRNGGGSRWVVLVENPRTCEGPVDAMVDLLEEVYERVGKVVGGMAGVEGV